MIADCPQESDTEDINIGCILYLMLKSGNLSWAIPDDTEPIDPIAVTRFGEYVRFSPGCRKYSYSRRLLPTDHQKVVRFGESSWITSDKATSARFSSALPALFIGLTFHAVYCAGSGLACELTTSYTPYLPRWQARRKIRGLDISWRRGR